MSAINSGSSTSTQSEEVTMEPGSRTDVTGEATSSSLPSTPPTHDQEVIMSAPHSGSSTSTESKEVTMEPGSRTEVAGEVTSSSLPSIPPTNDQEVIMSAPHTAAEAVVFSSTTSAPSEEVKKTLGAGTEATEKAAPKKQKSTTVDRPFGLGKSAIYNHVILTKLILWGYVSVVADLFINAMKAVGHWKEELVRYDERLNSAGPTLVDESASITKAFIDLQNFCWAYRINQDAIMTAADVNPTLLQSRRRGVRMTAYVRFCQSLERLADKNLHDLHARSVAVRHRADKANERIVEEQKSGESRSAARRELKAATAKANAARTLLFTELEGLDRLTGSDWMKRLDEPDIQRRVAATKDGTGDDSSKSGGDPA